MNLRSIALGGWRVLIDHTKEPEMLTDVGAIANMVAEICKYLETPAGQQGVEAFNKAVGDFNTKLGELFAHVHAGATAPPPTKTN